MSRRIGMLTALMALVAMVIGAFFIAGDGAQAARISDIRKTRHNLSASSGNTVRAQNETEVCVFCHTPHAASQNMKPLWNKSPAGGTNYTLYNSNSLDAAANGVASLDEPDGSSKLCLSCHDGTVAIGSVNVLRGKTTQTIGMEGGVTTMPTATSAVGLGTETGYTRVIGTDLSNDHPISFTYDPTRASNDGELFAPTLPNQVPTRTANKRGTTVPVLANRGPGAENKPVFPLEDGKMQCATCHDPHLRDDTADATTGWTPTEGPIKFLRESRLQQRTPAQGQYSSGQDILCLGCHNKDGWAQSAHAVAQNIYSGSATTDGSAVNIRQFPTNTSVQTAACLNCHDSHTVKGAKRLLRDGTDGTVAGKTYKSGGNQATEQTCYACHAPNGGGTVGTQGGVYPPNVMSDFALTYSMPIAVTAATERHDVGTTDGNDAGGYLATPLSKNTDHLGANGIEGRTQLGNRHAECTDCHNPHRTLKNEVFNGSGASTTGHHKHDESTASTQKHTNLASGALRGTFGVEPDYGTETSVAFGTGPAKYIPKFGDPGPGTDTTVGASYVTREYQICLKCHSSYAYGTTPPSIGPSIGLNNLSKYTDQAMEFASPSNDQREPGGNHRSWHPVRKPTLRTAGVRGSMNAGNWKEPWNNDLGNQTMYCTDCHGAATAAATTGTSAGAVVPAAGQAWGPHGSTNPFILKGPWTRTTGNGTSDALCFKCHLYNAYANPNSNEGDYKSGFGSGSGNLHIRHANKFASYSSSANFKCRLCHIAVPHGWKNKALLVNLNDVGPEAGLPAGTEVRKASNCAKAPNGKCVGYDAGPYYMGAALKILNWRTSGTWDKDDCGSKSGATGKDWMANSTEACYGVP